MYSVFMRATLIVSAVMVFPVAASSQGAVGLNPVYRRAQTMVNDGNGAAGRALVDSMISAAGAGSNEYVEGIYWRAVLAATAAEAESDYRRIVVEHPLSPRVEDVLLRLAQLDMSRANYDGALRHLDRLTVDFPNGTSQARTGYWMARVLFEKNDVQRACAATASALARTGENDAELRNQITYLNQRCAGVVIAAAVQPTTPTVTPSRAVDSARIGGGNAAAVVLRAATPVPPGRATPRDTVIQRPRETSRQAAPSMRPPSRPRDVAPSQVEPIISLPSAPTSTAGSAGDIGFTVQVAAYNVKSQADAMAAKLQKSGYETRVSGTKAPFRVRIGRYPTQSQAAAVQRSLKAKQITGIVVRAEGR
ncbi:MAG: SPOR domain-containing protein [Gemmatimonadaceae bacterium]